jgi:fumarate reductase subunit D
VRAGITGVLEVVTAAVVAVVAAAVVVVVTLVVVAGVVEDEEVPEQLASIKLNTITAERIPKIVLLRMMLFSPFFNNFYL